MNIPYEGRDFYAEAQRNLQQYVYAADREMAKNLYKKETMLESLEGRTSFSYKYRVMVNGMPRFFLLTLKLSHDGKHFVLYEKDIEEDIKAEILRQVMSILKNLPCSCAISLTTALSSG